MGSSDNHLDRLSDAIDAFLVHENNHGKETREQFLERHASLRDLLVPMLAGADPDGDGDDEVAGRADHAVRAPVGVATPDPDRTPVVDPGGDERADIGCRAVDPLADRRADRLADRGDEPSYLGGFRLVRELGRGGMGVVYEAEEVALGRRVALKVLPPHITNSPRQIERFRREASSAARLQHPGILPIYHIGQDADTHYFAMEYVDGPTIHALLQAIRQGKASFATGFGGAQLLPGLGPSYLIQVTETVAQVAEALAAAHAAGVIHRDIKPQNLMVGDDGLVKVVDFGLAKDLDRATISQSREVAGTPHYMSPEQIAGLRDVDHRTDIFSLGVVLYELLTLRCPFESDSTQGLMLAIATEEPTPLRKVSPRVPVDLQVICHKAMEKDPAHRYQLAAELGADLRRFLDHEPIQAQSPGALTRVSKLIRRRRAASLAVALALLLPISGMVFYYGFYRPAVAEERQRADANYRLASVTLDRQLSRAEALARRPDTAQLCREMTSEAVATLEEMREARQRFPSLLTTLGRAYSQMSVIHGMVGEYDRAFADAAKALEYLGELERRQPDSDSVRWYVAIVLARRSALGLQTGRIDTAKSDVQRSLEVYSTCKARDDVAEFELRLHEGLLRSQLTDSSLANQESDNTVRAVAALERAIVLFGGLGDAKRTESLQWKFVDANVGLAHLQRLGGRLTAAAAQLQIALQQLERMRKADAKDPVARQKVAVVHRQLGEVAMSLQQLGVARRHFETAVAGLRELRIETPDWVVCTTNLTSCLTDLAVIDGQTGQATAGVVRTDEAIELLSGLPKQDPTPLLFLSARGKVLTARASLRGTLDPGKNPAQLEQIAADFAEAIAAQSQVVDRGPTPKSYFRLSFAQTSYSLWLLGRRQFESAAKIARQAVVAGRQAFTLVPASESYCENLRTAFSVIASATVYQRDYAACEAAIREMIGLGVKGQRELHHVAVSLARAASLAGIDSTKKPQDRRATVNRLGDDAMDYLRRALAAGLSPVSVKRDPSFKILHRRADWHELTQQK